MTLSSDDEDEDDASRSMSLARLASYMPATGRFGVDDDDDESVAPLHADDATLSLDAPAVSRARNYEVVDGEQADEFEHADFGTALAHGDFEDARPPRPADPPAKYAAWVREEIDLRRRLDSQPWYQQATMVAAYAGVPLEEIIYLPSLQARTKRRPSFVSDFGHGSVLNRLVRFRGEATVPPATLPAVRRRPARTTPAPAEAPERSAKEDVQLKRQRSPKTVNEEAQLTFASTTRRSLPTAVSGSKEYIDGVKRLREGRKHLLIPGGQPNALATPADRAILLAQMDALENDLLAMQRADRVLEGDASYLSKTLATGLVFKNPAWRPNQELALDMVRLRFPQTLRDATIASFVRSSSTKSIFALLTAALFGRSYYVAGRRAQHTSDYKRLDDGIAYAMRQLRFAALNRRTGTVEIRFDALADFRDGAAARSPWCALSPAYAGAPYQDSASSAMATLRSTVLGVRTFEPLVGREARASPYGIAFGERRI